MVPSASPPPEPQSEENLLIARRFADLFEFAYDRFLDLQEKEQRARQAQIEATVGRIRAEAMAMVSSQDLVQVSGLVLHELRTLGVPTRNCMIMYLDDDRDIIHLHGAWADLDALGIGYDPARVRRLPSGIYVSHTEVPGPPEGPWTDELRSHSSRIEQVSDEEVKRIWAGDDFWMLGLEGGRSNHEKFGDRLGLIRVLSFWGRGLLSTRNADIDMADTPRIEAILVQFSDALALGFQRFLDFQQLEQASHNKSQFLRRMSHDLRSPMNAIIGYTRVVLRKARGVLDERQVHNLENIETSSNNLLTLINEILDLSRIEAGHVELQIQPIDLGALADECADALESIIQPGVELRREWAAVDPIQTDPERLRQVIMNLLGNAIKFTERGRITLSLHPVDHQVEIVVTDTGIGIPPEDLPHIFDEFRQVERQGGEKTEGTGLGLAIAKKTVELLGGTISAESEVGAGTKFTLRVTDYEEKDVA